MLTTPTNCFIHENASLIFHIDLQIQELVSLIPVKRMHFDIQKVDLSSIDLHDYTFHITSRTDHQDIKQSIADIGLINAPILSRRESRYIVISGFRRINACSALNMTSASCRIVTPDTSMHDCAKLAVSENSFQRELNLVEQSRALNLLTEFIKDQTDTAVEAASLNLPGNYSLINKIKKITLLPDQIQEGLLNGSISLSVILEIEEMERDEGMKFAEIFNSLKLSLNKQREIITLVKDIAFREDTGILEVLENDDISDILNNNDDRNQKSRELRLFLKQWRYPSLSEAEAHFDQCVKELKPGTGIKLIPPKYFEGPDYSLHVNFRDVEELEERKAALDKMIKSPALKKILE